jgi:hypothetical protein
MTPRRYDIPASHHSLMEDDMLTMLQAQALVRELSATKVLSVYLDTRVTDPAMRDAWRPALTTALRTVGAGLAGDDHAEFARAVAQLETAILPQSGAWGAQGWMALVTASGVRFADALPMRPPTMAVWRDGPVIAPYMRVLKQNHPVIVALVDSRSAMLYRYAWGTLTGFPDMKLSVDTLHAGDPSLREFRGKSVPAPRSATGTERADRRRLAAFRRLATALEARVAEMAGDGSWILIGGTPAWARLAGEMLPPKLARRTMVSATLGHDAAEADIASEAKHAASALRAARGRELLETMLERAGAEGRAVRGVPATQRALRARAVDLLVLSPNFLHTEAFEAEETVRAALLQGARVEVLSGDAAEELDRRADGVAGQLRFTLEHGAIGSLPLARPDHDLDPLPAA